jgi:vancomycin permeability regulator SanA
VLGAAQFNGVPSSILRARLDHAFDLYHRGLAPLVVVTGGKQPGDKYTEATASADYLHSKGVPDEDILREVNGRNSWESLAAACEFLKDRGVHRVLLVSDPFHSYRIEAIASELGLEGHPSPTRTSPITGASAGRHFLRETAAVAVGRIVGYRREAGIHRAVENGALPAVQPSSASGARWSAKRSAGALPDHSSS